MNQPFSERTYQGDGVPGGDGEDVGTGDGAGASFLQRRLDVVDGVEGVQREVGLGVLLRRVPLGGVDEHRPLAALHQWRWGGSGNREGIIVRVSLDDQSE